MQLTARPLRKSAELRRSLESAIQQAVRCGNARTFPTHSPTCSDQLCKPMDLVHGMAPCQRDGRSGSLSRKSNEMPQCLILHRLASSATAFPILFANEMLSRSLRRLGLSRYDSRNRPGRVYQGHDSMDSMGWQNRPTVEPFDECSVRAAIVQPPASVFHASGICINRLWDLTCGCNYRRLHFGPLAMSRKWPSLLNLWWLANDNRLRVTGASLTSTASPTQPERRWDLPVWMSTRYNRFWNGSTSRGRSDVGSLLCHALTVAIDCRDFSTEDQVQSQSSAFVDSLQGGRGWRSHCPWIPNERVLMGF
jgi:hypothetical protein